MKAVLLAFYAAVAAAVTVPAAADAPAAERARIAAERGKVEAQYRDEERACWGRFAVNDCLAAARAKRRSALADLRRQEISLNEAEHKQRAAERLRSMEQRADTAPPPAAPPTVRERGDRDAKAAQRAAEQAAREAEHARRTVAKKRQGDRAAGVSEELARREAERASRAARAAENVRRREALQREARERQEALQRRLAARQKPAAAPLPVPP